MNDMYILDCKKCVNEFIKLLESRDYLNKKKYEAYLDKYIDLFNNLDKGFLDKNRDLYNSMVRILNEGYSLIEKRNDAIVKQKLVQEKEYFDNMFKDIDSNILLDEEQRRAIVSDEDYSLIIAGAGSGKTTTMAAKVKYLIERKNIKPNRIILIAFTNKACEELDNLINKKFNLGVEISTFHKLGLNFIKRISDLPVVTISKEGPYSIVSKYVKEIVFRDKDLLMEMIEAFPKQVHFYQECYKFENFESYFKYYVEKQYSEYESNLENYINKRIEYRLKYGKTIDGKYVKSKSEALIANYLYINGYDYEYEKVYPKFVGTNSSYRPDFTVINEESDIYVEFYGLSDYREFGNYTRDDIKKYNELILKKRQIHEMNQTDCIELFPKENYLEKLELELSKRNVFKCKKTNKEIFEKLLYTNTESQYINFLKLMTDFIEKFKSMAYKEEDLDNFIENESDEMLKKQLVFTKKVYNYYNYVMHKAGMIDFNDMINYGYEYMGKLKDKYNNLTYDYLIIDEYQDISKQRYNFAKRITDVFQSKLVAVGDDWQAIFEFSGADITLFTDFYNLMGYADISKITQTYRNSQELIEAAGNFISKNKSQFLKSLKSNKHDSNPIVIKYFDTESLLYQENSYTNELSKILKNIYKNNKEHKVLLLGRYRDDIDAVLKDINYRKSFNDRIVYNELPNMYIDFMTIHSAKGLGYDQVIILNALNKMKGFPSKIKDEPLIKAIKPQVDEYVLYPGERRLFYVAMTRTKNKVYILCPNNANFRSEFVDEIILDNDYIISY